jgi:Flp pilus assembly protein TadG
MNARSRFSKGQMMAAFTIVLPVLIGVMALGADFAIIYLNWSMVQKAADSAALAGASQLTGVAGSESTVAPAATNYVYGYACLNGISDSGNTYATICPTEASHPGGFVDKISTPNVTDTTVQVGIKRTVPYFFGKMIGLNTAGVAATATAAVEPVNGGVGLFPVGLQCTSPCKLSSLDPTQSFATGQQLTFGAKFVGGLANGNWQWLDVGQSNAGSKALGDAIQNGVTGSLSVGTSVTSDTGNKGNSGNVKKGLDARLASCPSIADPCTNPPGNIPANDPCLVTMPAVDFAGCSGKCTLNIEGFAQIYLEQSSTTSEIDGCFIQGTTNNTFGSAGAPNLGPLAPPVLIN